MFKIYTVGSFKAIVEKSLSAIFSSYRMKLLRINDKSNKCFIGVGGGGSNILSDLSRLDSKHTYIHINSDNNALLQKQSKYKILLTSEAKDNK